MPDRTFTGQSWLLPGRDHAWVDTITSSIAVAVHVARVPHARPVHQPEVGVPEHQSGDARVHAHVARRIRVRAQRDPDDDVRNAVGVDVAASRDRPSEMVEVEQALDRVDHGARGAGVDAHDAAKLGRRRIADRLVRRAHDVVLDAVGVDVAGVHDLLAVGDRDVRDALVPPKAGQYLSGRGWTIRSRTMMGSRMDRMKSNLRIRSAEGRGAWRRARASCNFLAGGAPAQTRAHPRDRRHSYVTRG